MFNLFVNDIFYFIKDCQLYNYADDNVISYECNSVSTLKSVLENNLSHLLNWFTLNGMKANPNKFQLISFGNTAMNHLTVGDITIYKQPYIKYLGILVDEKLSFANHVENVCIKASRQVNALMRLSNLLDYDTKLLLYNAFISANYEYCPVIWSLCNKTLLNKLSKIQCRALRFVSGNFQTDYQCLLSECNMRNINTTFIIKIAIEMFKAVNKLHPSFVNELFQSHNSGYALRGHNNLTLKSPNTTSHGKLSLVYVGAKIWNRLPNKIKEAENLSDFKQLVYNHDFPSNIWFYVNDNNYF